MSPLDEVLSQFHPPVNLPAYKGMDDTFERQEGCIGGTCDDVSNTGVRGTSEGTPFQLQSVIAFNEMSK
jgi:hypothetical protein